MLLLVNTAPEFCGGIANTTNEPSTNQNNSTNHLNTREAEQYVAHATQPSVTPTNNRVQEN
jgi:hypothetical protein